MLIKPLKKICRIYHCALREGTDTLNFVRFFKWRNCPWGYRSTVWYFLRSGAIRGRIYCFHQWRYDGNGTSLQKGYETVHLRTCVLFRRSVYPIVERTGGSTDSSWCWWKYRMEQWGATWRFWPTSKIFLLHRRQDKPLTASISSEHESC